MSERHNQIIEQARATGRVSVEPLAEQLGVTVQTIRRDLADLCDRGLLQRVHGGAVLTSGVRNLAYRDRQGASAAAKEAIAQTCVADIPDGTALFLGIGTTTEAVARRLTPRRGLLVVTNNLNVATILTAHPDAEVFVTGGTLRAADGGLVGWEAAEAVARFNLDLCVLGTSGLSAEGDLLDFDRQEVTVNRSALAHARRTALVADGVKWTRTAPVRLCPLDTLDAFYTDTAPPIALDGVAVIRPG